MPRRRARAIAAALAGAMALTAATGIPAIAQTDSEPGAGPRTTGSLPTPRPQAEAAPAATPTPTTAETPAAPIDPVLAEVRRQLAEPARGAADRADRAALAQFYAERTEPLPWVASGGLTPRARHAIAEIRKADDWGLSAAQFELPSEPGPDAPPATRAAAEISLGLAALKYARHARGGRIDPAQISRHLDQKPPLREPKDVLAALAATDTAGDVLRDLHPRHEQFQRLREALLKLRGGHANPAAEDEPKVRLPVEGPLLKPGMEHPDVALLRRRLKVPAAAPGQDEVFDPALQAALVAFQKERRMNGDGIVGRGTRVALNGDGSKQPALAGSEEQRLIINMERWRWMPERLGALHIWDNIPEYTSRVFKNGQVIHTAKIIVGKVETPTAVFSANMKTVVFHPEWGVPDSIKVKELAPYLSGGGGFLFFGSDTSVLDRQRLRVVYNGRTVPASSVNWGQVDIRRYTFIQSAGPHNVLGVVKFLFPNKHDIYMHDTPQRELFEQTRRTFSHGCIRVHNPGRLAELILAEDKGWSSEQVRGMLAQGYNNEVQLAREIPVHVAYFTAVVDETGKVAHHGDVYGHDARMVAALGGRPLPPEITPGEEPREARRAPPRKQTDFLSAIFGN